MPISDGTNLQAIRINFLKAHGALNEARHYSVSTSGKSRDTSRVHHHGWQKPIDVRRNPEQAIPYSQASVF
jgi:hypothetical protein